MDPCGGEEHKIDVGIGGGERPLHDHRHSTDLGGPGWQGSEFDPRLDGERVVAEGNPGGVCNLKVVELVAPEVEREGVRLA